MNDVSFTLSDGVVGQVMLLLVHELLERYAFAAPVRRPEEIKT